MLTRSFWYFQQLIQIETSFTMNSTMHQVGYSLSAGLVGEGRRSWALERQSHKDTRAGFSVASAHPGWAQSGLGWQLLMYFKGREESQRIRDAKTGNETKLTDHFPLLTVPFLWANAQQSLGMGARLRSWNLKSQPFY